MSSTTGSSSAGAQVDTGLRDEERQVYERRIASLQRQLEATTQALQEERALHMEQLRVLQQRMDAEHRYYAQQLAVLRETLGPASVPQSLSPPTSH